MVRKSSNVVALALTVPAKSRARFPLTKANTSSRVGRLFFAAPAVMAVLAWLFIDQPPRPLAAAGLGVGLIGMVSAARRPTPAIDQRQPVPVR